MRPESNTLIGDRCHAEQSSGENPRGGFPDSTCDDLEREGFEHIRAQIFVDWLGEWTAKSTEDLSVIERSFDELAQDSYMPRRFGTRNRGFSKYHYSRSSRVLTPTQHDSFLQQRSVNALVGGIERNFAPLQPTIRDSPLIHAFVNVLLGRITDSCQEWSINVHQIRIDASEGMAHPAPEGMHQDGHDYVAIIMMNRVNVVGGFNHIYDKHRRLIFRDHLTSQFDCLLINDRKLYHGVSPVLPAFAGDAYRDTFVIDFNKSGST